MKNRRTEITIETYEVLVMSRHGSLSRSWCAGCGQQVAIVSLDDACYSGLSLEVVQQEVEAGRIHLVETSGGSSLICLNSLIRI